MTRELKNREMDNFQLRKVLKPAFSGRSISVLNLVDLMDEAYRVMDAGGTDKEIIEAVERFYEPLTPDDREQERRQEDLDEGENYNNADMILPR